jgi:CRP-like cAMP-binding protein
MIKRDVLRNVPLLSSLSETQLEWVASSSRVCRYPKGSIVFHEGDTGDYLLVILRGRVKVVLLGESGHESIIAMLEPPNFLGEVALIDQAPRSATVVAVEETEFLQIASKSFQALISEHPEMAVTVMRHLAKMLRESHEQIRTLSMFDAYGRIVRCLLGMARDRGTVDGNRILIRPRPSQQELARMIGCSRETVTRGLKTLQSTGYVTALGRDLAIEQRAIRRYLEPALQNLTSLTRAIALTSPGPR